ncbi:unnamed protein product [Arctogadus glacialis]
MFGDMEDLDASLLHFTSQFKREMAEEVSCQEDLSHTNQTIELAKAAGSKGWRVSLGERGSYSEAQQHTKSLGKLSERAVSHTMHGWTGQPALAQLVSGALACCETVLVENRTETVDPIPDPLQGITP